MSSHANFKRGQIYGLGELMSYTLKSHMSSKLGQSILFTLELPELDC